MTTTDGLPKGWEEVALSQIAEVRLGRQRSPRRATGPHMVPYLRAANVTWKGIDLTDVKEMDFTPHEQGTYRLEPGDILLSEASGSPSEVGKPAIWRGQMESCCFQNTLIRVRSMDPDLRDYLHRHFLADALTGRFGAASRGVGIHHLGAEAMSKWVVRIAPAQVRNRIVEAVDRSLSRLDETVALLERVQRNLRRYRASVLKAAVEGRLVPTEAALARAERRDYEPASAFLKRILAERRSRWEAEGKRGPVEDPEAPDTSDLPRLPTGWCWAGLEHFLLAIQAGKNFQCLERPPEAGEVGVVKVSAVTWGTFDEQESKTCPSPELVNEEHFIRPGDFLISRANTIQLVAACVIVSRIEMTLMLSDKILRLRTVGKVDPWLMWVLRSSHGRREIESLATGNQESMRNIGQERIRAIRVPLPPEAECRRIVAEVERQITVIEHSEGVADTSGRRCSRLRQSILKWAFEGKLVDQDPKDEPASALLARIRAERVLDAPVSAAPRRTKRKK